jgi:hypothetical protein
VTAIALEAVTASIATAAKAKIKIDFKTGLATRVWVMGFPSDEFADGERRQPETLAPSALIRIQSTSSHLLEGLTTAF